MAVRKSNNSTTTPRVHEGKVKWAVRQALQGGDLEHALNHVKANDVTRDAAHDVYRITLERVAHKVAS